MIANDVISNTATFTVGGKTIKINRGIRFNSINHQYFYNMFVFKFFNVAVNIYLEGNIINNQLISYITN